MRSWGTYRKRERTHKRFRFKQGCPPHFIPLGKQLRAFGSMRCRPDKFVMYMEACSGVCDKQEEILAHLLNIERATS